MTDINVCGNSLKRRGKNIAVSAHIRKVSTPNSFLHTKAK
jgi:hypothetical protein